MLLGSITRQIGQYFKPVGLVVLSMLTYTTYSEAGGIGKTTLSAHLAAAHARAGRDVLVIDGDPQDGSLSYLFDVADERDEGALTTSSGT